MTTDLGSLNPTKRFSDRVENYAKYRPSYPQEIIPFLEKNYKLSPDKRIVDVGSGTGHFAELFLKNGYPVTGLEPNDAMRKAAETKLRNYPGFTSRNHRAESTGLRTHSVDFITVAQAFHWMEPVQTKKEFLRILKPGGHIILAWNLWFHQSLFIKDYQALKQKFSTDIRVNKMVGEESIRNFFHPMALTVQSFSNFQWSNFESLKGQLLSASYIPLPGHPSYNLMIDELIHLFIQYNENGLIRMEFETSLYTSS